MCFALANQRLMLSRRKVADTASRFSQLLDLAHRIVVNQFKFAHADI